MTTPEKQLAALLGRLIVMTYCPSCGCDLWNTAGCQMCQLMRDSNEALADRGLAVSRKPYPAYAEADEINVRNMGMGGRQ